MPDRTERDVQLVTRFLEMLDPDWGPREIADAYPGITYQDVRRWRAGDYKWLTYKKRRALRRALGEDVPNLPPRPSATGEDGKGAADAG